ncbi:MAG: PAS domain-containing protein [Pseudomonadota bacterium]
MTLGFLDRLRPRRDPALPVVFAGLSQTRAYWEGLRHGPALPSRRDVDPRGLVGVLDRVFLADRIGRGLAQIRIAGSGLNDFAGADVRGLPISCLFGPDSRSPLAETLEHVFIGPAIAELDLGSDRAPGDGLVARLLLLPLTDETGGRLVLGVMGFADPAPSSCKLQIRSRREERLVLDPVQTVAAKPQVTPIRRMGHLSLVHSAE